MDAHRHSELEDPGASRHHTPPAAGSRHTIHARDEAIITAVADGMRRYGPRKLTAQDVADAAGISRMTFYRAMGSMDNAILIALTREFTTAVERIHSTLPAGTGAERLAAFVGDGARGFVASRLVASVLAHQPELLEPYLSGRLGRSQEVVLAAIETLLAEGRADGSIGASAPSALTLLLLIRGIALGAPLAQESDSFERACAELTSLVAGGCRASVMLP